ncbi:MAG: tRNA pseudouridine(54/55) synthase Pus10 [Candidatus Aenigmarchaeota archaeon]|nr:tRNA pseudouridine(54/55) synthase Pus10 [Candidatus Aenigmarchaeota archaeon]
MLNEKVFSKNLCDHCLGRLYSGLLSGHTSEERGKAIRLSMAMMIDSGKVETKEIDMSNFHDFKFRNGSKPGKKEKCWMCSDIFDNLDKLAEKCVKRLGNLEFSSFLVGSKVSGQIHAREEKMWEINGIENVETIKTEINRELGKRIERLVKKPVAFKRPDILILANLEKARYDLQIGSLYVFGYYSKRKRGFPQCKWGTPGVYKTSVQEIIAKPFLKATESKHNSFHGGGREDIDARCMGWRPFVIEIEKPVKRKISLAKMRQEINKGSKVKVKSLKFCDRDTVVRVKTERGEKAYRVTVLFSKPVDKSDLKKLYKLKGVISQRTPTRVSHRRADLVRKRKVLDIKYKRISSKKIELMVKTNAGLYVKELVSGNGGRTKPSVSSMLGVEATPKDLDVTMVQKTRNV